MIGTRSGLTTLKGEKCENVNDEDPDHTGSRSVAGTRSRRGRRWGYLHVRIIIVSEFSMILPSELLNRPEAFMSVSSIVAKRGCSFMQLFLISPISTSSGTLKVVCVKIGPFKFSRDGDVKEDENRTAVPLT